jgi:hypothetical protein
MQLEGCPAANVRQRYQKQRVSRSVDRGRALDAIYDLLYAAVSPSDGRSEVGL